MHRLIFSFALIITLLSTLQTQAMCGGGIFAYEKNGEEWFYGRQKIEGADKDTFHVLSGVGSEYAYNPCMRDSGYAMDKAHVYRGATALPEADPKSFSLLDSGYARDATHIYFLEKILNEADPKTFTQIQVGFFKDASHVYLGGTPIPDADPATFTILDKNTYPGTGLTKDAKQVFFGGSAITGADPKNVQPLGRQYWISNKTIFSADKPLTPADPATFKIAGDDELAFSAEDKDRYFLGNRAVNKSDCRKIGEITLACHDYILAFGHTYTQIDSASLHYLGRFPHHCQVIENSMIYQDRNSMYEFYGDGTIWKFIAFQPDKPYEKLDEDLQRKLCAAPVTQWIPMNRFE